MNAIIATLQSFELGVLVFLAIAAVGIVIGLFVRLIRALMQVQNKTLSFAIKLLFVASAIAVLLVLFGQEVLTFTFKVFDLINFRR